MSKKPLPGAGKLMIIGVVLVVVGILCCVSPAIAGGAVTYVIGFLLLGTGLLQMIQGFREQSWISKLLPMILGLLTVIAGGAILAHPYTGLVVLTLVLALSFLCEGVWKIVVSFSFRPAGGWVAMMLSGVIAIVIGGMIYRGWPESSLPTIGVLIGVNVLMTGIALIVLASTLRQLSKAAVAAKDEAAAAEKSASTEA